MADGPIRPAHPSRQARNLAFGVCALSWLLGVGLLYVPAWQSVERKAFDVFSIIDPPAPSLPIVIVAIDDASFTQLDLRWPWPRSVHANLLRRLAAAGAAVIAFDVQFSEHTSPEHDADFAAAIAEAGNVVLAADIVRRQTSDTVEELRLDPAIEFTEAGARSGLAGMVLDGDRVARRVAMQPDSFWRVVIDTLISLNPESLEKPWVPGGALIRYLGPAGTFTHVSYYSVLQGDASFPPDLFAGAMVLIGLDSRSSVDVAGGADRYATPFTLRDGALTPGVEIHATQIENALMGQGILPAPRSWSVIAISLPLLLILPLMIHWHPVRSSAAALLAIVCIAGVAYWLFQYRFHWVATLAPAMAVLAAYAGTGSGAYLIERRRARDIRSAFARYVSAQIVEEMIEHPERLILGGQRREITVLFADLEGFTGISERLPPDAVGRLINVHLNAMTRVIIDNGGMVDKFIGDAVMAIWGAPLDDEQHAAHALRAALGMQEAMRELQPRLHEFGIDDFSLRIGLSSGPAIVGNMGSDMLFDYTAVGDTVNLAARLESANKAYSTPILLPAETATRLSAEFALRRVDRVKVKGRAAPVDLFTPCADPALAQLMDEAWQAYAARDWQRAASAFARVLDRAQGDAIATLMMGRVKEFARNPPAAEWDGATALEKL